MSALAPKSNMSNPLSGSPMTGKVDIKPGRSTFLMRPTMNSPAANSAPVLPAEKIASASPFLTACAAKTMEAVFLRRIALTGSSSLAIFSSV